MEIGKVIDLVEMDIDQDQEGRDYGLWFVEFEHGNSLQVMSYWEVSDHTAQPTHIYEWKWLRFTIREVEEVPLMKEAAIDAIRQRFFELYG